MGDEMILTEIPPLRAAYAPLGEQAVVPIKGNHAKRMVFGALNISTGHLELLVAYGWDSLTWQIFLKHIRRIWRGWHIVLFIDRGSPHKAQESQNLAKDLAIEVRWLPVATPELNAMEGLWRDGKDNIAANRTVNPIDEAVDDMCRYLLELSPRERLRKAGVLSGRFWLTN